MVHTKARSRTDAESNSPIARTNMQTRTNKPRDLIPTLSTHPFLHFSCTPLISLSQVSFPKLHTLQFNLFAAPEEVPTMFRVLRYFAATAILAALLALPFLKPTASISNQVSVIVELRDEPAAVYKARTEKAGGTVSQEQLKAYRDGLTAKQADFLKALS